MLVVFLTTALCAAGLVLVQHLRGLALVAHLESVADLAALAAAARLFEPAACDSAAAVASANRVTLVSCELDGPVVHVDVGSGSGRRRAASAATLARRTGQW